MRNQPKYMDDNSSLRPWQHKMHEIIYEADTTAGKVFDIGLLVGIVLSIVVVMLESIPALDAKYHSEFNLIEWIFTVFFTLEYFARMLCIGKPLKYIFSFYGIIDLLSILPSYIGIFMGGKNSLMVIRGFRLMRIFRILKLGKFLKGSEVMIKSLKESRHKIAVFLLLIITTVSLLGTLMYLVESPESGFTSIPTSIYWAIVTLTTVGYGDIAPITPLGQLIASAIMILGYAIIAVPTGIVTSELMKPNLAHSNTQSCISCSREGHDSDAYFCKYCGEQL
jgi:voltage-gated potassium channel